MANLAKARIQAGSLDFEVQFNPSELSLSRGVTTSSEKTLGGTQKSQDKTPEAVATQPSRLSMTLYFDAYLMAVALQNPQKEARDSKISSKLKPASQSQGTDDTWRISSDELLPTYQDALKEMAQIIDHLVHLVRFNEKKHSVPKTTFTWGSGISFEGYVTNVSITYTMFDRSGSPTRAKANLEMAGEEPPLVSEAASKNNESPDRTKERLLLESDQMWMLAQQEYGDPSLWKVIARENGILNPRKIDRTVRLKLPPLR